MFLFILLLRNINRTQWLPYVISQVIILSEMQKSEILQQTRLIKFFFYLTKRRSLFVKTNKNTSIL